MIIPDEIIYDLLSDLDNDKPITIYVFTRRVKIRHPDHPPRNIIDLMRNKKYIKIDPTSNLVFKEPNGVKFFKRIKRTKIRDEIIAWGSFFRTIFWIIISSFSILYTIFDIFKKLKMF